MIDDSVILSVADAHTQQSSIGSMVVAVRKKTGGASSSAYGVQLMAGQDNVPRDTRMLLLMMPLRRRQH